MLCLDTSGVPQGFLPFNVFFSDLKKRQQNPFWFKFADDAILGGPVDRTGFSSIGTLINKTSGLTGIL